MNFPFRQSLLEEVKSYANNTPLSTEKTIDLSLGVNPFGCPPQVKEAVKSIDFSHISDYPHSKVLHEAIAAYWSDIAPISCDEILTSNGSICGLYYLCNLFSGAERKEVVGFIPTFTDMVEAIKNFGMTYKPVVCHVDEGGAEYADDIIKALSPDTAFVYLDRPQNPFGLTIGLEEVEKILKAARENGSYVIMDEAYGDFIPREEASIVFRPKYDNLIVSKTFSKGLGLANIRAGYIIAEKEIIHILSKTLNPYVVSDILRNICSFALEDKNYGVSHAKDFAAVKTKVRESIGRRMVMLNTDDRVPICTLKLINGGNLQEELMKYDLLAVSGAEFEALDESYVRIRVPEPKYTDEFIKRLNAADKA